MPKIPGTISNEDAGLLKRTQTEVMAHKDSFLFRPTDAMAKVKAKFWERYNPGPLSKGQITLQKVLDITGTATLNTWWKDPSFKEWFLNQTEEREKIRFLFNKSLDSLAEILESPSVPAQSKITAIRLLAELSGNLNKSKEVVYADAEINKMSQSELESFLQSKGVKIVQEINVSSEKKG